jgi:hypothetical protein
MHDLAQPVRPLGRLHVNVSTIIRMDRRPERPKALLVKGTEDEGLPEVTTSGVLRQRDENP